MCGIYCQIAAATIGPCDGCKELQQSQVYKILGRRGPDSSNQLVQTISVQHPDSSQHGGPLKFQGLFSGHVLHQRGALTSQPLRDSHGNVLLWNGEIFDGILVDPHENDGQHLLTLLQASRTDKQILATLSQIKGPWSFIYWQESQQCLWFGRDCLGRRSLLWGILGDDCQTFCLSSVAKRPDLTSTEVWSEVPTHGIFCLSLSDWCTSFGQPIPVKLFSWKENRTSSKVDNLGDMLDEIKEKDELEPCKLNLNINLMMDEIASPLVPLNVSLPTDDQERALSMWTQQCKQCLFGNSFSAIHKEHDSASNCEMSTDLKGGGSTCNHKLTRPNQTADQASQEMDCKKVSGPKGKTFLSSRESTCQDQTQVEDSVPRSDVCLGPEPRQEHGLGISGFTTSSGSFKCEVMRAVSGLTQVLQEAVRRRVFNLQRPKATPKGLQYAAKSQDHPTPIMQSELTGAQQDSIDAHPRPNTNQNEERLHCSDKSRVAILYSGGIDSMVIAALADRCVPQEESMDLINVAFQHTTSTPKDKSTDKKHQQSYDAPDRLTGRAGLEELRRLNPFRKWNFVEVNVSFEELQKMRRERVSDLVYPLQSVMDDSIGCAIWFAARGIGCVVNDGKYQAYESPAKVVLVGMGADEQLAGYSRHRTKFKSEGWRGLVKEINMDVRRIATRNLGRDDRIISDHGRETRLPFLDEDVVNYLNSLPMWLKADLRLPRGTGEKLLLRVTARALGLGESASLPKRAIQFGSRIAKLEDSKEKASQRNHTSLTVIKQAYNYNVNGQVTAWQIEYEKFLQSLDKLASF